MNQREVVSYTRNKKGDIEMQYHDLLKVSDDGKGLTVKGHPCEVSEKYSILTLDIHYAMDVSVRLNCSMNFDASKIIEYLVNLDTNLRPYKSPLHSDIIRGMAGVELAFPLFKQHLLRLYCK